MVQNYLDLLSEDLIIKIIEMRIANIEKTLLYIENTIAYVNNIIEDDSILDVLYNNKIKYSYDDSPCSMRLSICKNIKPKKFKIMIDNKICYIPYDVYDINYGYIKYEIPDKYLNSYSYLFSRYPLNNVIIILKKEIDNDFVNDYNNDNYFNNDYGDDGVKILYNNIERYYEVILQSPVLKNPQYFDILRETNKLYIKLTKFRYYLGQEYILNEIFHINKKGKLRGPRSRDRHKDILNYKYYNITPEEFAKYNYITTNVLLN